VKSLSWRSGIFYVAVAVAEKGREGSKGKKEEGKNISP